MATAAMVLPQTAAAAATAIPASSFGMHYVSTGHPYPKHNPVMRGLDAIVNTYRNHHVQPLITLGMTPAWAAHACNHVNGRDWGIQTCALKSASSTSP